MTILLVDAAARSIAAEQFPTTTVYGVTADGSIPDCGGAEVIVWCAAAEAIAARVDTASRVGVVNGGQLPGDFRLQPRMAMTYLRANVRPYTGRAASEPAEGSAPASVAAPVPAAAVVDVPAAIEAAKTDPGALLEPAVIAELAALRRDHPAEFARVRESAKGGLTPLGELDRLTGPKASVTPITEARTRQQAKPDPAPQDYLPLTDDALARSFTAAHPNLRHVARWGQWLEWTDDGWIEDDTFKVFDLARQHCAAQADAHRGLASPSQQARAKAAGTRAAVESLARADRAHAMSAEAWDADPMALNTPGGIVCLTDGSIRPARPDDYCRKRTAATPRDVPTPAFTAFLRYATRENDALLAYLQRLAGYCMTGQTREQHLTFIHGPGGAGKGTFLNLIGDILGDYTRRIAIESLTEQRNAQHSEDLARLIGARLAISSETEQGRRWAESRVKALTGEDTITARFMRQNSFEFRPQLKLVIMGNYPPGLRNVDQAFKRRLHIVPFTHLPEKADKGLSARLWGERDGIAWWMLQGCLAWQREGLNAPKVVTDATDAYFEGQDLIGQWIEECCEVDKQWESKIGALYQSYAGFCERGGNYVLRQGELKDALGQRGFERGGYAKSPTIKGIRLAPQSQPGYMPD